MNEFCKYMQGVRLAVFSIADSVLAVLEQSQNKKSKIKKLHRDIRRERARLGGDWAIATVITSRSLRDFVRLAHPTLYI